MNNITPSNLQNKAIRSISQWFNYQKKDKPYFYLAGYAGTGKTSIVNFVLDELKLNTKKVLFATYTGKAAKVLMNKSGRHVNTIHRLIYKLQETEDDGISDDPCFTLNAKSSLVDASLLILDEVSMVDKEMMRDILSFNTPVLVSGDPMQIPPVNGDAYFEDKEPDFFLDEIHRQALDSPIIYISMLVREKGFLPMGKWGDVVAKIPKNKIKRDTWLSADQVLCGKNNTKRDTNRWFRNEYGLESMFPVSGEKIICLRNNWNYNIVNGTIAHMRGGVTNMQEWLFRATLVDEDSNFVYENVELAATPNYKPMREGARAPRGLYKTTINTDFGYAITCHKSQGSQWDKVLIIDEGFGDRDMYGRWLYTAVTRASEKLIIAGV